MCYGGFACSKEAEANEGQYETLAGRFLGDVEVTGTITEGAAALRIDHPLDPENKYLQRSYVESAEMLDVHSGNAVTDSEGYASVDLPEWFEAGNRDFRYQLTVIGDFAQAIVAEEISNNRFTIRTDKPNVKVSRQVTGVRNDPWAQANRVQVEQLKPEPFRGFYRNPEAYGLPKSRGIGSLRATTADSE